MSDDAPHDPNSLRHRLFVIVFGTETPAGRAFDIGLLVVIALSVAVVMLESVASIREQSRLTLRILEWVFTGLFTIEYGVRLYCARHRWRYALSFFGVVDLLSLLPSYLSFIFAGAQTLLVIRVFRLLRVFRVLKVVRMIGEAHALYHAIRASMAKIIVFLGAVLTVVVLVGTAMHLIEGRINPGFDNIPSSMYWAIVTLTTVGYGDIAPMSVAGKALSATLMILGYGIIAVPTGIVSAELVQAAKEEHRPSAKCRACGALGHREDAHYCRICGEEL